jgi:hypothetical protein
MNKIQRKITQSVFSSSTTTITYCD